MSCLTVGACSMMHTDVDDCPTGLYVTFKYDYNIQRADMFKDHVGGLTVYVFDEDNKFVMQQEENNVAAMGNNPLKSNDYKMRLNLPEGKYRLVALANQKSYAETLNSSGAKYRRTQMNVGDDITKLQVTLDRTSNGNSRTTTSSDIATVPHENMPMDTLWHAINSNHTATNPTKASYDTLSLMRNTNTLTVSLRQIDDAANISHDDFEIYLVDNNGTTNHDNSVADDEDILYTAHDEWDTDFKDPNGVVIQKAAHYGLNFNRLIYNQDASKNAVLVIRNKETQKNVAEINLPDCLAQGRNAEERYIYSPQEFLDREHNYKLEFFLKGDSWVYMDLSISILSWSMQIGRAHV